ncbi:hypothetical protein BS47DRAFT_1350104 [Hydnum rufescens UP504]|uniref:Uncharacterized protein n=1 Tax=Hydnum rufescens UP504 TaxID=1448309 RepID=A0A9P6DN77_9AGAM|nr:hypothetical protein BS47DRAFT_1350104 [Hydnum rufescens UP504]
MSHFQQTACQGPEPIFDPDEGFYDHTTVWTTFWQILRPNNLVDFEDACNTVFQDRAQMNPKTPFLRPNELVLCCFCTIFASFLLS